MACAVGRRNCRGGVGRRTPRLSVAPRQVARYLRRVKRALLLVGVTSLVAAAAVAPAAAKPAPPPADAPADPVAGGRELAKAAEAKAKAGDFLGAAASYHAAFRADPRPEYVCNVGVAYYKAPALPQAQFFLTECVLQGSALAPTFLDSLRKVQAAIEAKLRDGNFTPVSVAPEPASATVAVASWAADETFVGARTIWLPWGAQTLTVSADGYVQQTVTPTLAGHDVTSLRVTLARPVAPPPIDVGGSPPVDPSPPAPVDAGPRGGDALPAVAARPSRRPAIIATVATGAVGLGALGAYLVALDHATDARATPDGVAHEDLAEAARRWRGVAVAGAALAAAGAGVSAYLWYRSRPTAEARTTVGVAPSSTGATAFVAGTF